MTHAPKSAQEFFDDLKDLKDLKYIRRMDHQDQLLCQIIFEGCPSRVIESLLDQGLRPEGHGINFASMRGRDDVVQLLLERGFTFSIDFKEIQHLEEWMQRAWEKGEEAEGDEGDEGEMNDTSFMTH